MLHVTAFWPKVPHAHAAFRVFCAIRLTVLQANSPAGAQGPLGNPHTCFDWFLPPATAQEEEEEEDVTKNNRDHAVDTRVVQAHRRMLQFEWESGTSWSKCIRYVSKAVLLDREKPDDCPVVRGIDIHIAAFEECVLRVAKHFDSPNTEERMSLVARSINEEDSCWCAEIVTSDIVCTHWLDTVAELPQYFFTQTDQELAKDKANSFVWKPQSLNMTWRMRFKRSDIFTDFVFVYLVPDVRNRYLEEESEELEDHWSIRSEDIKV